MTTRPELVGSFGMVASTHWLASSAGMAVLEGGGNAVDAACAAGFVLQVVEPHLNGPGGDLPALVWSAAEDRAAVVCGQGVAPAAASLERFAELGLTLVPGTGLLAATVPGAFGAWTSMLERWGTWELADVLAYALHYAESGFPVLPSISRTIDSVAELFTEHWLPSARTWLTMSGAPRPGSMWRSPDLARTYRRIVAAAVGPTREQRIAAARREWYSGFVAAEIDRFCTSAWRDSSGRDHRGLLTGADLATWAPSVEDPVGVEVGTGFRVLKTSAWGQGPMLLQQLQLLSAAGIEAHPVRSADWIHLVVESAKLCLGDREAWYGDDPDVPLATLLSAAYAAERAHLLGSEASLELRPGSPDGRVPRLPRLDGNGSSTGRAASSGAGSLGEPTVPRTIPRTVPRTVPRTIDGDTCHLDVMDRWGNAVSATPSGGWLQSSPVIPELGFPLGTRAQMFYLEAGLPNSLRPGVRPRTTLSPTLVLRDGEIWLACGTPGGDQQDQWQVPFLLDVLGGAGVQESIDAPMFHTNHAPSSFYPRTASPGEVLVEDRLPEPVLAELERRGHRLVRTGAWTLGRLSAVGRNGETLRAGADPRGAQAYAVGR